MPGGKKECHVFQQTLHQGFKKHEELVHTQEKIKFLKVLQFYFEIWKNAIEMFASVIFSEGLEIWKFVRNAN